MSSTPSFVITSAGLDAALLANEKGFKVEITKFSLGSAFGYDPTVSDTKLKGNILYSASPSNYRYKGQYTVMITCVVPASVGPFDFGEIGLYMSDGTLFALASWDTLITKYSFLESEISSTMTFYCYLTIAQGAVTITVDLGDDNIYKSLVEILDVQTWREVSAPSEMENDVRELIIHEISPAGDSTLLTCTDDNKWTVASTYRMEFANLELVSSTTDYVEIACGVPGVDPCKYHASSVLGQYLMGFADGTFEAFARTQYITGTNRLRLYYKAPLDTPKKIYNGNDLYCANSFPTVLTVESLKDYKVTWDDIQNKPTTFEGYGLQVPSNEIGIIGACASTNIPAGKVLANGAAVSRTGQFAKLFSVIGTMYGAGNGVSTFNLPDARGLFLRYWDGGRGIDTGRGVGTYQDDGAPEIWGKIANINSYDNQMNDNSYGPNGAFSRYYTHTGQGSRSGSHDAHYVVQINASRCNRAYGRANEVRGKNIALVPVITYA